MTMVSVVIPSWNTRELLRNCLESLKINLPHSSEVIVVDNGSHDGSAKLVAEHFQHVRLIRNQRNMGFAHATNQGVEAARGAYVLFLSTDTVVVGNAIKQMLAFLEQNLRYGATAPRLVDVDGTVQRSHMRFPSLATPLWVGTPLERWFPKNREIKRYYAHDFDYELDSDVEHPPATCLLMRRKALRKTKPLDETLWLYFNDVDLCRRLWEAGWRIAYLAGAKVVHYGGMSTRQFANSGPEWHKNRLAYYRKHYGRAAGWFVKACVGWTFADHCVRECWRRAHGLDEQPLLPVWQTFSLFLKH